MTINHKLKINILNDFLLGLKREYISKKQGISTGSISAIAEEFETDIPDILKLRAMMVRLTAAGNDPKVFYHAIRLHDYIKTLVSLMHKPKIFWKYFKNMHSKRIATFQN